MSPDTAPARRAPIREVAAARTSYHRARTALEALPERRLAGAPSALFALARLSLLGLWGLPSLVRHPATRSSPTSTDIDRSWQRFVDQRRALVSGLPLAVAKGSFAESLAATAELAETFDLLVRKQLPLAHRAVVADYEAGYDPSAAYASYRCDAANRGRVGRPARVDDGPPRSTPIGGLIWPSAVIDAEGNAYLGHADGEFVSLAPDGSVRWRHADPQMLYIDSTGALGRDGFLYMASTDVDPRGHQNQGRIWKLDPSTGEVAWAFWGRHFEDPEDSEDAHLSSFFEGNLSCGWEEGRVVVYAGSDDGFLYKLDDAGELVWEYDTEAYPSGVIWTKPLLSPDGQTVYVGDLAEGMLLAVEKLDETTLINISSGIETPIREVVEILTRVTGFEGEVVWDTSKPDGQLHRRLDTTRADELLGWRATTPLEEGLKRTVEWYRTHADEVRK